MSMIHYTHGLGWSGWSHSMEFLHWTFWKDESIHTYIHIQPSKDGNIEDGSYVKVPLRNSNLIIFFKSCICHYSRHYISINGRELDAFVLHASLALLPLIRHDRLCPFINNPGGISLLQRILRRGFDAKVSCQSNHKNIRNTLFAQHARESTITHPKRIIKRAVHLHALILALFNNSMNTRDI